MYSILTALGFILVSWGILIALAIFIPRLLKKSGRRTPVNINYFVWVPAAALAILAAVVPSQVYEFDGPDGSRSLAKVENNQLIFAEPGYGFWEDEGCCITVANFGMSGTGTVTALTANPKVRTTHYYLDIFIMEPEKYYLRKPARQKLTPLYKKTTNNGESLNFTMSDYGAPKEPQSVNQDLALIASSLMYQFNDQHSKEVVLFSNPLDQKQYDDFKALIEGWMNERLASDGLMIVFKSFKVE